ncbi:hypothetical protein RHMOL_Rhmol01G0107900 [Rhododendron molle]|uniref:Uncharacterized protein n=1 Tax=Rhododendron molle TaxID=49168 RepID=A0ACC0Q0M5_RHOML|nr:hypothetical protein RHMOL_Rhmol01G0107900 [Rhododendron molle]
MDEAAEYKIRQAARPLIDITNDSPITGIAMGKLKTPSSALTLFKNRVEEVAEFLKKLSPEGRPFLHLKSPAGLLAPTPVNTPQVLNLSGEEYFKNFCLALVAPPRRTGSYSSEPSASLIPLRTEARTGRKRSRVAVEKEEEGEGDDDEGQGKRKRGGGAKEYDDNGDLIICKGFGPFGERAIWEEKGDNSGFRGKTLVSIREYYSKDGKGLPSTKGNKYCIKLLKTIWTGRNDVNFNNKVWDKGEMVDLVKTRWLFGSKENTTSSIILPIRAEDFKRCPDGMRKFKF